jgi:hypothetical protein
MFPLEERTVMQPEITDLQVGPDPVIEEGHMGRSFDRHTVLFRHSTTKRG